MKPTYKYGIITGIMVGLFAIGFFSAFNWFNTQYRWGIQAANVRGISGLLTIIIQATGIYFSMAGVKQSQSGKITYGQSFKAGLTVAIITALITALFGFIYCTIINPGYVEYMVNEARKSMIAAGKSSKQISNDVVGIRWQFSTTGQVVQALVAQTVVGTIISLLMAIFIESKKKRS
ncbi:MAG: DUF4199 domain-containing protein [Sphingobacteriales bacterium]